jgi:cysteine desulfurase/selenocysteine lyase
MAVKAQPKLDAQTLRADFPAFEELIHGKPLAFLDSAVTSQKPRQVLDAMRDFYATSYSNVHRGVYTLSERATEGYEGAREKVRAFLNAPSTREVIFVRQATEGLNLVAYAWGLDNLGPGDVAVVTELEHHSNLIPWQVAARDRGATVRAVPLIGDGRLDLDALDRLLGPRTRVVAFAHVSNVLGTITPVADIVACARRVGALTLVDGAQAVPHMPVDISLLGCDFYAFSGHKMFGPTGIGVLYGRRAVLDALEPARGGSEMIKEVWVDRATWNDLPWRFEPGTPPIAEAVGLDAAIEYLEKLGMERVRDHTHDLAVEAATQLAAIPGVRVFGPRRERGAVVAFSVEGLHPHDVAAALDADGIAVRAGHHCAQPLMRWCGVVGTSRASFSVFNSPEDVALLAHAVADLHRALR